MIPEEYNIKVSSNLDYKHFREGRGITCIYFSSALEGLKGMAFYNGAGWLIRWGRPNGGKLIRHPRSFSHETVLFITNLFCFLLQPPHVWCETKIWHPNISENGEVCLRYFTLKCSTNCYLYSVLFTDCLSTRFHVSDSLLFLLHSLLREHTLDGSGWAPTRKLKVHCRHRRIVCRGMSEAQVLQYLEWGLGV